jgi:hypothetical protein
MRCKLISSLILSGGVLTGCMQAEVIPESAIVCKEPRPQMCTMDYRPACGYQSSTESKTYSNACSACSQAGVKWVIEGECK